MTRPIHPRDAASLILFREGKSDLEILMGKRGAKAKFIPDAYVFPGGRLESTDHPTGPFKIDKRLARHVGQTQDCQNKTAGLVVAALRETHEETGLVPQADASDHLSFIGRAITPSQSPIRFHARFFALPARYVSGGLAGDGELSDLRWLTIDKALSLPVIDVTEYMLGEVRRRHGEGTLEASANVDYSSAIYTYRNGSPSPRTFGPV